MWLPLPHGIFGCPYFSSANSSGRACTLLVGVGRLNPNVVYGGRIVGVHAISRTFLGPIYLSVQTIAVTIALGEALRAEPLTLLSWTAVAVNLTESELQILFYRYFRQNIYKTSSMALIYLFHFLTLLWFSIIRYFLFTIEKL